VLSPVEGLEVGVCGVDDDDEVVEVKREVVEVDELEIDDDEVVFVSFTVGAGVAKACAPMPERTGGEVGIFITHTSVSVNP